jgi:hypothetical protein
MINKNLDCYSIITDEKKLIEFIEWLPDLKEGETYFLTLFARNKWYEMPVKKDKAQLKRLTSKKDFLLRKIEQLEIPVGKYKFDDYEIPNEAMGIYIHINPRSLKKAMQDVAIELTRKGFDGEIVNPVDFSLTAIQKRASNRRFHIYDFDSVEVSDVLKEIIDNDIVNLDCLSLIKTRGGFHLLLDYAKVNVKYKNFYNKMAKLNGLDGNASGDCLTPVVGCCQGGFTPILYKDVNEFIK